MQKRTITNTHHFCKGVTLEIEQNEKNNTKTKLTWLLDENHQKFKYGTIRVLDGKNNIVLEPKESVEQFIKLLNLVF